MTVRELATALQRIPECYQDSPVCAEEGECLVEVAHAVVQENPERRERYIVELSGMKYPDDPNQLF